MNKNLSTEEQVSLVTRYHNGESVRFLSDESGVSRSSIYRWIHLEQTVSAAKATYISQSDIRALERRASRQERIIRILRASPCAPGAPLRDRLTAVEQLSAIDNINIICEALGVAKGTYYNHILRNKRDQSEYAKKCTALKPVIQKLFDDNKQIFGAGKITAILKDRGYQVAEKTVAKIMHEAGLFSIRSSAKTLYLRNKTRKENVLQQNFAADAPDRVWVSDVTSYNFKEKTYYICVIIDLFARLVVSCRVSMKNSTQLVKKPSR